MFKRRSFIALLAVGVLVLYAAMNYFQQRAMLFEDFQKRVFQRERVLRSYVNLMTTLGQHEMWDDAHDNLTNAVKSDLLDFYLLTYKDTPVWAGSMRHDFDPTTFHPPAFNQLMASKTATFETLKFGDYQLTIGITKDLDGWMKTYMVMYHKSMEQEAFFYVLIVIGVALYLFRDFFKIIRSVRDGRFDEIAKMKGKSAESDLFVRGFSGFVQNQQRLQNENLALSHQVLPSLQKEIFSGRKPPYDFKCTLVRTDINNFSHIYNTHDVGQFMGLINEFFIEVSHVVSRYQGLVHEFIGDEIIYFFKDDDHANSFLIAMSAIRDVNAVADRFHKRAVKDFGYDFTVKSSLAHGVLRFGPLVNGFSLAGSVLIETVRILAHVNEKSGNVIYFDSRHVPSLEQIAHSHEAVRTSLKGFSGERALHAYDHHEDLASILGGLSLTTMQQLTYFRDDAHLLQMIGYLQKNYVSLPESLVLRACHELRRVQRTGLSQAPVIEALWAWIDELNDACVNEKSHQPWKILSAAIMLIANLVSRDEFDLKMQHYLEKFTHSKDKRVAANALEVLMHLRSAEDVKSVELFIDDENTRLSANALVFQARSHLDSDIARRLRERLKSKDVVTIASGLYAMGEIGAYHQKRDPVALQMQTEYLDLYDLVADLALHENESVRLQAGRAVVKIADSKLTEAVLKLCRSHTLGDDVRVNLEKLGAVPGSRKAA